MILNKIFKLNTKKLPFIRNIFHNYSTQKKFAVLITTKVDRKVVELLNTACNVTMWTETVPMDKKDLIRELKGKDGLFCTVNDKIDRDVIEQAADKLKVIGTMSVGYDHLQLNELKKNNIRVGYLPTAVTDATAELTVALLLTTARRLSEANEAAKKGKWSAWEPYWMCGLGLKNSIVGIVGYGRIGQQVARLVKPFKVKKILIKGRTVNQKEAKKVNATEVTFDELLRHSDFIVVNCSLTSETKNMFNTEAFKKMKKNAVFVNASRGPVVDQGALLTALKKKQIFGAGLDVTTPEPLPPDHELYKLPNCIIVPHIGSATIDARDNMGMLTAKNILSVFIRKPMQFELKF